jgi:hypothetical protein
MGSQFFGGLPGIASVGAANFKALFMKKSEQFLAGGKYLSPAVCRDPSNTTDIGTLQPGLVLGKLTSVVNSLGTIGNYGPSIYGLTGAAIANGATSVTLPSAAVGTEILRRRGATGTVKIIGPPTAGGVVRTGTITYSAIVGTTMTVTATGTNEVQQVNFNIASTGGSVVLKIPKADGSFVLTTPASWNATDATYLAAIQAVLDVASGVANGIVVTAIPAVDTDLGFILTFSGTGYAGLPANGLVTVETLPTSSTAATVVRNTTGASGAFVTKSIIAPTDGSENPLTFVSDWSPGIKVTDDTGASISSDVELSLLPIAGEVDVAQMINFPLDASLITWLEQQLSTAQGGKFTFGGVGGVY